jgi:competence protein ComEA
MQQILAWLRNKQGLVSTIALALGIIVLAATFIGESGASAVDTDTPPLDEATTLSEAFPADAATVAPQQANSTPTTEFVVVYISGAVRYPDVYQVPAAARIKDVVLAAGGLTDDADSEHINLADRVADAQHVHIPRQGDGVAAPAVGDADIAGSQSTRIDLNTAGIADLDALDGIGQSLAQRIVEYRTTNGPFQSIEDLQKVKGIGPALFAKIAPSITVGP